MVEHVLTLLMFAVILTLMALYAYRKAGDGNLLLIFFVAGALRLGVGFLNIEAGPLPGAEVDAVRFERIAASTAFEYNTTGEFQTETGAFGYGSLLAVPYVIGGRDPIYATLLNLVFFFAFLIIVYDIVRRLGHVSSGRKILWTISLYPTSILYTAVPLREAALMWALALWLQGMVRFYRSHGRLINLRSIIGVVAATFLHSGFIILLGLTTLVWWAKGSARSRREGGVGLGPIRLFGVATLFLLSLFVFLQIGGGLEKLPENPTEVANAEYLNSLRGYKGSYGTGYATEVPQGAGLIASVPVLVFSFLFSPTPLDALQSGTLEEIAKSLDSILFFIMTIYTLKSLRSAVRRGESQSALILGGTLAVLLIVFSVGTANVGIAMRHRAKFAWLFLSIIHIWRPPERIPEPAEETSRSERPLRLATS